MSARRTKQTKPAAVDVEVAEVRKALGRAQAALEQADYELLAAVVENYIAVDKELRRDKATIRRLRRMVGITSTEKTSAVLGNESPSHTEGTTSDGAGQAEPGAGREGEPDSHDGAGEKSSRRKGHGRRPASDYKGKTHVVPLEELHHGCCCPACEQGRLRQQRPVITIRIQGQEPLPADRWEQDRYRCDTCGQVFTAPLPEEAGQSKYGPRAASMLALLHYSMGTPFSRLATMQEYLGVPVPASTQWDVVLAWSGSILPVYQELLRHAANGTVLHNDDTYVRILEFMGKRRAKALADGTLPNPDRTGLFTTAVVSITGAGPIAIFASGRQHAGENLDELLAQRASELELPLQMCDGLERNIPKEHDTVVAGCLCHGRRHIVDEADSFPSECRHVLDQLRVVFKNEATCKKRGLSEVERLHYHQKHSAKVMSGLEEWMQQQLDNQLVEPNSGLGKAFEYLLGRWDKLTLFLRVPGAPIDNNLCERILKMAIRYRNNSKFYRSLRGAEIGDLYMTLIFTAQLHRENPFEYLIALMTHAPLVARSPAEWLPWTFRATLARLECAEVEAA